MRLSLDDLTIQAIPISLSGALTASLNETPCYNPPPSTYVLHLSDGSPGQGILLNNGLSQQHILWLYHARKQCSDRHLVVLYHTTVCPLTIHLNMGKIWLVCSPVLLRKVEAGHSMHLKQHLCCPICTCLCP